MIGPPDSLSGDGLSPAGDAAEVDFAGFLKKVDGYLESGMKRNDALKAAAADFGLKRKEAYDLYQGALDEQ